MEQLSLDLSFPDFYHDERPAQQISMNFKQSFTWLDKRITADKVSVTIAFMDGKLPQFKTVLPEDIEGCELWAKGKRTVMKK